MIEEQLEAMSRWNAVPDLMIDPCMDEDRLENNTKMIRDKVSRGRRKRQKEDDVRADKLEQGQINKNIRRRYRFAHRSRMNSIGKIREKINRKLMIGKFQISGRGYLRWCFTAEYRI